MFKAEQSIYYLNEEFEIKTWVYKGYIKLCPFTQIVHIIDDESQENILINEDFVFNTYDEAKEDLFNYEN